MIRQLILSLIFGIGVVVISFFLFFFQKPIQKELPEKQEAEKEVTSPDTSSVTLFSKGLKIPWEIEFLPKGGFLVTERGGKVRLVHSSGSVQDVPVLVIPDVATVGEGGLLGIALHPKFSEKPYVYFYYTYVEGSNMFNKVVRYSFSENSFSDEKIVIDKIPGDVNHNGGRIKFGPDSKLYITTGDAQKEELAQDKESLAGKILRLNEDGSIPSDNPFPGSRVYSLGHRNPQGLAWDKNGLLWETEHGPSANDEINLIKSGGNYGWPDFKGDESGIGIETPVLYSKNLTWAPSGAVIVDIFMLFSGLRGEAIYRLDITTNSLRPFLKNQYGRLRTIAKGPDGFLYILTSNLDGRGKPVSEDDRILRVHPSFFYQ